MRPRQVTWLMIACFAVQTLITVELQAQTTGSASADSALKYLRKTQDKYHRTFDVYTDQDAAGNHFVPSGFMAQAGYKPEDQLKYQGDSRQRPHSGQTCIKITTTFSTGHAPWTGLYFQYPENNWGDTSNAGYNLTGADSLIFWAKGENGGEKVDVFTLGIGWNAENCFREKLFPDASCRVPPLFTPHRTLNTTWTRHAISLRGVNLSYVIGGFGFAIVATNNSNRDIVFYLDDIQFVLNSTARQKRLDEPRLLLSYMVSDYDRDFAIRNSAFTKDNALAMLALMANTTNLQSDDWKRAKLIGDAFVICQNSDRYFRDGRLRNGYQAGDLLDRKSGYSRLPGWSNPDSAKWFEIEYAAGTYTGDVAWVINAWLTYNNFKKEQSYVDAARKLGLWIRDRYDQVEGGYRGGFVGFDTQQNEVKWFSIEHNTLVYAAFMMLYEATGDSSTWLKWAINAREWVERRWDNPFPGRFPEALTSVHALAYLCIGDFFAPGLAWVENNCLVDRCPKGDPFGGFDYDTNRDGVWFEGTAQMSLAFKKKGDAAKAEKYLKEIEKAQIQARNKDGLGIVEACHDSVTTGDRDSQGKPVFKTNRLHIGTTAWYILAKSGRLISLVESSDAPQFPAAYSLESNYPNPAREHTTIAYNLPKASKVTLEIYNVLGQKIRTLVDTRQHAGYYSIGWDGKDTSSSNVPNGMYFYRIIAESFVETRKLLLIR